MKSSADPHLPLKPLDFLILLALVEKERHGYGIRRDIAELTEDRLLVDAGNLYRSLRRLMEMGLLERSNRRPSTDTGDERRRYYKLTAQGRRVVSAEARRLRGLLHLERVRKLLSETPR